MLKQTNPNVQVESFRDINIFQFDNQATEKVLFGKIYYTDQSTQNQKLALTLYLKPAKDELTGQTIYYVAFMLTDSNFIYMSGDGSQVIMSGPNNVQCSTYAQPLPHNTKYRINTNVLYYLQGLSGSLNPLDSGGIETVNQGFYQDDLSIYTLDLSEQIKIQFRLCADRMAFDDPEETIVISYMCAYDHIFNPDLQKKS